MLAFALGRRDLALYAVTAGLSVPAARRAARVNLLAITVAALDAPGVPFAVIGATALPAHGVNRTTADLDLSSPSAAASTSRSSLHDVDVPIVRPADLMLLKLFAGGPHAWDIDQLLDVVPAAVHEVEAGPAALPADCHSLWRRMRDAR